MDGHTLKLLIIYNRKLPLRRRGWPLVISAGETVWVCGLRMSENFKVNENTRDVICLELVRNLPVRS
jgi:hypothetical protein